MSPVQFKGCGVEVAVGEKTNSVRSVLAARRHTQELLENNKEKHLAYYHLY